jgi:beta-1,4-mannosyl-glycoprotein beta-1,4-N-acetylglucosaminyltransferase
MSKVYDCFLFFNELDLLDLRLNLLNDIVDKFVIVESTVTFSGKPKRLFFQENKELFKDFEHKIIHVIIENTPNDFYNLKYIENPIDKKEVLLNNIIKYVNESTDWPRHEKQWGREIFQRESIIMGLVDCSDDDLIMISDLDEFPNPIEFKLNIENFNNGVVDFKQKMFYYYINFLKEENWSGPKLTNWNVLKNNSLNLIRQNKLTNKIVNNGGWHLSFMGGEKRIKDKIDAYAHQEFNNDYIKNNITNHINNKSDLFFRGGNFKEITLESEYPDKFFNLIKEKYVYLIHDSKNSPSC